MTTYRLLGVSLLMSVLAWPAQTWAIGSSSYEILQYDLPQSAGTLSSTTYGLQAEIAPSVGVLSSTNYGLDDGFPAVTGGSITLMIDSSSVALSLTPGTPATGTSTVTVATNAASGYTLAIQKNQLLTHTDTTTTISDVSGTIASPAGWSGTGFGFSVVSGTSVEAGWSSGANYAAIPTQTATTFHTVGSAISSPDATLVRYKLDTDASQTSGRYLSIVSFLATVAP